jgi:hypothetical protein
MKERIIYRWCKFGSYTISFNQMIKSCVEKLVKTTQLSPVLTNKIDQVVMRIGIICYLKGNGAFILFFLLQS